MLELSAEALCLALTIYFEARGEALHGKLAVAQVVMNRVEDERYPNTICDVTKQLKYKVYETEDGERVGYKVCAFSWYCDGKNDVPQERDAWIRSRLIATAVLDKESQIYDLTEGSLCYHASYVSPIWGYKGGNPIHKIIGEHYFYQECFSYPKDPASVAYNNENEEDVLSPN